MRSLEVLKCCFFLVVLLPASRSAIAADRPVRFNRDVRPVLTDKCFACHGPDAETVAGDLRLDLSDSVTSEGGVIVPGNPEGSELVRRIFSNDAEEMMPPAETHKPLTQTERELLRRWIAEGSEYEAHWAYTPLQRPALPEVTNATDALSPVDQFIDRRLMEEGIAPAPLADRITLIRRLSFDLTGLPPTPQEVDEFVNDLSDDAYGKLVNRLLESSHYGERMAIYWLDLVRYADTVGYHGDQDVSQFPYRDYVIDSFNDNKPYDQFLREQLAGDLLPEATIVQQVASGYNRLNQTTEEGGAQAKEYLAIYFADRVRNVSQVFMGATMGCAQCHDHKYDPYTMRDFYSLGAFFADLEEQGKYSARARPPEIQVPIKELQQQIAALDEKLAELKAQLVPLRQKLLDAQKEWEAEVLAEGEENQEVETVWINDAQDTGGETSGTWDFVSAEQGPVHSGDKSRRQSSNELVQHFFMGAPNPVTLSPGLRFFVWVHLDPENPPKAIMLQLNDGSWEHRAVWGSDDISFGRRPESWAGYRRFGSLPDTGQWVRLEIDPAELGIQTEGTVNGMAFTQFGGLAYWDEAGWGTAKVPRNVADALKLASNERTEEQSAAVREHYLATVEPMVELKTRIAETETERNAVEASAPTTVVSKSVAPREIRILPRGNWMDDSGDIVEPSIPAFLGDLNIRERRATRLDLANWLCESENPLTSRVMVNRLWSLLFGRGICQSVDDLGGQGTFPSNPDLLDWLAVEFVESGWDIKYLIRTIVMSNAYQRSSRPIPELKSADPDNDLFARQGRFRLDAEMVRDVALLTSGLLVEKVGGESVKPYQPAGYYAQLNFPRREYAANEGDDQYRRGVYTHWQRTFLHPMLKAFDAPSREECTAKRSRSNTPLQALTLLNDPTFVEAARVLAARIMREGGEHADDQINWAYRAAVSRSPETAVADELKSLFERHLEYFSDHPSEAKALITEGNAPVATDLNAVELAAWTSVARVVLNLHETITRY
ncbi:MAG: DUF1553 domain-containing protein [Planctomycetaceae bacterium]|nr:DUF1553 domain-containing protein [Planctomycetaceae bacterium]